MGGNGSGFEATVGPSFCLWGNSANHHTAVLAPNNPISIITSAVICQYFRVIKHNSCNSCMSWLFVQFTWMHSHQLLPRNGPGIVALSRLPGAVVKVISNTCGLLAPKSCNVFSEEEEEKCLSSRHWNGSANTIMLSSDRDLVWSCPLQFPPAGAKEHVSVINVRDFLSKYYCSLFSSVWLTSHQLWINKPCFRVLLARGLVRVIMSATHELL